MPEGNGLGDGLRQSVKRSGAMPWTLDSRRVGHDVPYPYHCLGRAHYCSHESERPMKVLRELERPMPGWLYQAGKVVAG